VSETGADIVSFNSNVEAVTLAYRIVRRRRLPLLPLVLDFTDPTPSRGIDGHSTLSARERLQGQLVIGPGCMPTIASNLNLRTDLVVRGLAAFSSRWLILNGVPRSGPGADGLGEASTSWHLDSLMPILSGRFRRVDIVAVESSDTLLVVCED
jgi:hypothetical protein